MIINFLKSIADVLNLRASISSFLCYYYNIATLNLKKTLKEGISSQYISSNKFSLFSILQKKLRYLIRPLRYFL